MFMTFSITIAGADPGKRGAIIIGMAGDLPVVTAFAHVSIRRAQGTRQGGGIHEHNSLKVLPDKMWR